MMTILVISIVDVLETILLTRGQEIHFYFAVILGVFLIGAFVSLALWYVAPVSFEIEGELLFPMSYLNACVFISLLSRLCFIRAHHEV